MKKIELEEQKKLLVDLLKYITDICDKNNIKYTLIAGSLIGAIRHKGIIPWDDDIDIALMPEEYEKLINVLSKTDHYYVLFNPVDNKDYFYPFAKLVDTRTILKENGVKEIKNYGIYVDIFAYHYVPNNEFFRKLHYFKLFWTQKLLSYSVYNPKDIQKFKSRIVVYISKIFGTNFWKKRHLKICNTRKKTDYLLSNWPAYGYKHEIQETTSFAKYKKVKFENISAMIIKDYDKVLKTVFGNYMQPPPENQRNPKHGSIIHWK